MAGSQLKQLKAALKSNGLIGQSNGSKKDTRSSKHTARDRAARTETLNGIRDEFNRFDERINRTKRDYTVIQGGKFVRAGSSEHNRAAKLKGTVEKSLVSQYTARQQVRNKSGGLVDRRFGAKAGKNLTEEEIMLERFTRERQQSSKSKRSVFALGSDDEEDGDDDGFVLTHSGKALASEDASGVDFDEDALGSGDKRYVDEGDESDLNQPARKKSKKEVMQEIIAKSKFHKRQRQAAFEKTQEDIGDLDDDFTDVMQEINGAIGKGSKAPAFLNKTPEELEYDNQVRQLTYDRRAVPADRTKTDEELQKEREDRRKKLEQDRLDRMNGMVEREEAEADDLDDDFWAGSDNEAEGFSIKSDDDAGEESEDEEDEEGGELELNSSRFSKRAKSSAVVMPVDYDQFAEQLQSLSKSSEEESFVKKIVQQYQPHLAQGNKEKMNQFVIILYRHCLSMPENLDLYFRLVKNLLEKYNEALVNYIRHHVNGDIHKRIQNNESIEGSDLINFTLVGMLFSTSDHYHLVVTPSLIVIAEILARFNTSDLSLNELAQGIYLVQLLFKYQTLSKRYIPEAIRFIERAFMFLSPDIGKLKVASLLSFDKIPLSRETNIAKTVKHSETSPVLSVLVITGKPMSSKDSTIKFQLLAKCFVLAREVLNIYRELLILFELALLIRVFTSHLLHYYPAWKELVNLHQVVDKVVGNTTRNKLALQQHRLLAIATFAPKFEENFNPDRKSYDLDVQRQEVSKMQRQLKKEKKETLKDLRRVTRFEARQQIEEKKTMYDAYHKKMHDIVALILTHEGAEKNQYEREKRERKGRK